MVYMASCGAGSCTSANTASLKWFKIAETGLISGTLYNGTWGLGDVMKSLKYDAVIPASLAPGEYMIRVNLLSPVHCRRLLIDEECVARASRSSSGQYASVLPGM